MNKAEILNFINETIEDEKGNSVSIDDKFIDGSLDSLGTTMALITIDTEFNIFDDKNDDEFFSKLDIENLTIRDLITLCRLSNTDLSTEQKLEKIT